VSLNGLNVSYVIALAVALAACITDLRTRRIPNALTFGAAAAGLVFHAAWGSGPGFSVAGWAVGVAVFFVPFVLGGLGGGDVKLLGALGAWLGPKLVLWLALYTGIAGGVLAVIVAIANDYLRQAISNIWLLLAHWRVAGFRPLHEVSLAGSRGPRLAYAVPILVGTVCALWLR
jgi:prepilin peptidase CpaA